MEHLSIYGGKPLHGEVKAAGAKNSITKLLVASLLSDKRAIFYNVPDIKEVEVTVDLCREIGSEITWNRKDGTLEIITKEIKTTLIPQRFSGANRIPILMLGALLGRTRQEVIVPLIGGCKIGPRPVDFHIDSLRKLGATIELSEYEGNPCYIAKAEHKLQGTVIKLPFPSVGATENTILAAAKADGKTVIKNAAVEPEIIDLILFLQKSGVIISVDVNRTVSIERGAHFYDVEHRVIPDRIEAASLGMAAISTRGRVFVEGAEHMHMIPFLNKLREIGAGFTVRNSGIEFYHERELKGGIHLETDVHPGFLTDWQQPFVVLLTQASGHSIVHETIYENRFGYTTVLNEMGADTTIFTQCLGGRECRFCSQNYPHSLVIKGPTKLHGKKITIPDLRAGYAYVMAALMAEEESQIYGLSFLDRGYENLDAKLISLGANLKRVSDITSEIAKEARQVTI